MNRTIIANAGQTCGSSSQLETKNVQHVPAQSCSGAIGALTAMRGYGLYGLVTSDSNVDGDCREIVERLLVWLLKSDSGLCGMCGRSESEVGVDSTVDVDVDVTGP